MFEELRNDQQQRWRKGERVLVEAYVQQHPGLANDPAALTELILAEIALRRSRGETPDLDDYVRRFSNCETTLRQRSAPATVALFAPPEIDPFATVAPVAKTTHAPAKPAPTPPPSDPKLPTKNFETIAATPTKHETIAGAPEAFQTVVTGQVEATDLDTFEEQVQGPQVPGYEIIKELGRGGMGIVYKALQLSADRLVALKVVRNDVLETMPLASRASTLERFQQEAQAAAKLEHDNLVTVFEVGTAGGMRYYAMRFVEGRSFYDMLRDAPLDNRRAAQYMEPVARGLHYAHQRGILHRDLKPHNILVDEHTDRPLVADFGLAKFMERRDELTHAGEVMGTPSYMPPEQAQDAASVTASADVYSLGATLYHVLTLRPPFQAANVAETIRQIIYEEPVAPRQLNPAIDRDLETICLKCLQKEPVRRYETADLLADDLRRYLNGEPILARPISLVGRTWRWCRRKPLLAGLIATAAISLTFGLGAALIGYRNTKAALAESESRLQKALAVVNELFTRLSEDELLNEPGMQPLRKDLLARALKHYQYFLTESGGNAAIRDEVAAARFRVGLITQVMGSRDTARDELLAARALQQDLLKKTPEDSKRLKALADTLNALGSLFKEAESLDDANKMYTEAVSFRTRLVNLEPNNVEYQRLLANVRMNLGLVEMGREKNAEARDHMLAAQAMRRKLLDTNPKARRDLAMGFYNLATLSVADKQDADATRYYGDAIQQFEQLQAQDARSLANRFNLAVCYRQLATLQVSSNDIPKALVNFEAARTRMESLAVGNPDVLFYQTELVYLTMNMADLYDQQNDLPAARRAWTQVLATLQGLRRLDARNPDYRSDEANALVALGKLRMRTNEDDAAAESFKAAKDRLRELLGEFPKHEQVQGGRWEWLVEEIEANLGRYYEKKGDLPAARKAWTEALHLAKGLRERLPNRPEFSIDEAVALMELGKIRWRSDEYAGAKEMLTAARDRRKELIAKFPKHPDLENWQWLLEESLESLGALFDEKNDLPLARSAWSDALSTVRTLLAQSPKNSDYRREEAKLLRALGKVLTQGGEHDAAAKSLTEARDRLQRLLADFSDDESLKKQLDDTVRDLNNLAAAPEGKER